MADDRSTHPQRKTVLDSSRQRKSGVTQPRSPDAETNADAARCLANPTPRGSCRCTRHRAVGQSASAVTVAAIAFVNAGLLTFTQTAWVLFGANVGTTMTGWLVALIGAFADFEPFYQSVKSNLLRAGSAGAIEISWMESPLQVINLAPARGGTSDQSRATTADARHPFQLSSK